MHIILVNDFKSVSITIFIVANDANQLDCARTYTDVNLSYGFEAINNIKTIKISEAEQIVLCHPNDTIPNKRGQSAVSSRLYVL